MLMASLVFTILVFVAGIMLGVGLNDLKNEDAFDSLRRINLNTESYVVERDFINFYDVNLTEEEFCSTLRSRFYAISNQLNDVSNLLVTFEEQGSFTSEEYDFLVREYFLSGIKHYLLLEEFRQECDAGINTIIFFYGLDTGSEHQGVVLDTLFKERDDLFIVTVKYDYNKDVQTEGAKDPLFDIFQDYLEIETTPTVVVNGEKFEGVLTYGRIDQILSDE
tara:strand:+ start:114 stop:776 length:663 start_codon:yes stop_codon:yes gene_type:complete